MRGRIVIPKINVDNNRMGWSLFDFFYSEINRIYKEKQIFWYAYKLEDDQYLFLWSTIDKTFNKKYIDSLKNDGFYIHNYINKLIRDNMKLKEKFEKIMDSPYSFSFETAIKRIDGEWESKWIWKHFEESSKNNINECCWDGFDEIEDCVNDCLRYINNLE